MSQEIPVQSTDLATRSFVTIGPRLSRWLAISFIVHLLFIVGLFYSPWTPTVAVRNYPVYSVDLVGGEKLGGNSFGTELATPSTDKTSARKAAPAEPAAPAPPKQAERVDKGKKAIASKPEKPKRVEAEPPAKEAVALKLAGKKEPAKKESSAPAKAESSSDSASLDSVRERIMQSAVERARSRNETAQKSSKGEVASSGAGENEGAAALGKGGRGGGEVRGIDFLIYRNRMLETIKTNWSWAGRGNLKVVVHFSVKENGEILGLKVVQPSGDPSYDESVLRAVKKSSPLSAPPESYRKDFADVELLFRPQDLGA
jgi:colicin import membrane protein